MPRSTTCLKRRASLGIAMTMAFKMTPAMALAMTLATTLAMTLATILVTILAISPASGADEANSPTGTLITLTAADNVTIFADEYVSPGASTTVVLLHQAGANARSEYRDIIPQLVTHRLNVLAVDLRLGGQRFGSFNRTVAEHPDERSYCAALPDIEAAVRHVEASRPDDRIILWGSSYSAALVILVAAEHPKSISGVLAFSPASGEPMEGCRPEAVFEAVQSPLLIFRPARETEVPSVATQIALATAAGHQVHIAANGVHGSSMLVSDRTGSDTSAEWDRVSVFIESL